jgi:hypothetical protein
MLSRYLFGELMPLGGVSPGEQSALQDLLFALAVPVFFILPVSCLLSLTGVPLYNTTPLKCIGTQTITLILGIQFYFCRFSLLTGPRRLHC